MDYTAHGILQARIPEWVAFPFSRGSPYPGIEPGSPALQVILYQLSYQESQVALEKTYSFSIFWPCDVNSLLTGKDLATEKDWRQKEKGVAEDEMVG